MTPTLLSVNLISQTHCSPFLLLYSSAVVYLSCKHNSSHFMSLSCWELHICMNWKEVNDKEREVRSMAPAVWVFNSLLVHERQADIQTGGTPLGAGLHTHTHNVCLLSGRETRCVLSDRHVSGQRTSHIKCTHTGVFECKGHTERETESQEVKESKQIRDTQKERELTAERLRLKSFSSCYTVNKCWS